MRITSDSRSVAFRRTLLPGIGLFLASSVLVVQLAAQAGPRTVELTAADDMKYDKTTIEAKPGEQLHIKLTPKGTMPKIAMSHNWVLLKLGTDAAAFVNAGMSARATDFIAPDKKSQVIASTPLAGNGETVETTFKVPTVPGSYTYLCTFTGHFAGGMKGTLVVKK
jgi:azurin